MMGRSRPALTFLGCRTPAQFPWHGPSSAHPSPVALSAQKPQQVPRCLGSSDAGEGDEQLPAAPRELVPQPAGAGGTPVGAAPSPLEESFRPSVAACLEEAGGALDPGWALLGGTLATCISVGRSRPSAAVLGGIHRS